MGNGWREKREIDDVVCLFGCSSSSIIFVGERGMQDSEDQAKQGSSSRSSSSGGEGSCGGRSSSTIRHVLEAVIVRVFAEGVPLCGQAVEASETSGSAWVLISALSFTVHREPRQKQNANAPAGT